MLYIFPPEGCYCRIGGDTHIRMFDGGKFDNQAPCMYTLTKSLKPDDECRFNVEVKQEHRGEKTNVAYLRMLRVETLDTIIELLPGRLVQVSCALNILDTLDLNEYGNR